MTPVTPHDIAALAETRRRDPVLALSIAEQAGKAHDLVTPPVRIETKDKADERRTATNAR